MRKARHDLMGTADLPGVARRAFWWPPRAHPSTRHRHDGRCSRSPLLGQLSSPGRRTQVRMASKSGCGTCLTWSRNDHADPIGERCGGERQALEDGRIAAQAAPPVAAGRRRPGGLHCRPRYGSRHLVAQQPERTAGHRQPVRCRGTPRLQHPKDRDEFVFFGRANGKRSSFHLWVDREASSATAAWSGGDPKVRAWVEPDRPVARRARYLGAGYPPPGRRGRAHRPSLERRPPFR